MHTYEFPPVVSENGVPYHFCALATLPTSPIPKQQKYHLSLQFVVGYCSDISLY